MDKKQHTTDKLLSQVYKQFDNDPETQEFQFLNTVFDFLNRRSSYLAKPGVSNKVVQMVHNHINSAKQQEVQNQSLNEKRTSGITKDTKKSISEQEAKELENEQVSKTNSKSTNKKKQQQANDQKKAKDEVQADEQAPAKPAEAAAETKPSAMDEDSEEEDLSAIPPGNGGRTDKYVWTQTLSDVEMAVEIDANLRGKHLNIQIKKKHLFIAVKGKESTPIIDGELKEAVNVDDSTWTLEQEYGKATKTLTVSLVKVKGMNWWDCVIVGDDKIDTTKIQPENSKLDSLDDDTRQTVEKMMWDQRQKMRGLPTSKELEQQKILERFKAQHPEMDFSNLKMAPDQLNQYTQQ